MKRRDLTEKGEKGKREEKTRPQTSSPWVCGEGEEGSAAGVNLPQALREKPFSALGRGNLGKKRPIGSPPSESKDNLLSAGRHLAAGALGCRDSQRC